MKWEKPLVIDLVDRSMGLGWGCSSGEGPTILTCGTGTNDGNYCNKGVIAGGGCQTGGDVDYCFGGLNPHSGNCNTGPTTGGI